MRLIIYNCDMHLLIVIGAGASYDCWPKHVPRAHDHENWRLPLANQLFSPLHHQNILLDEYNLMGIASPLRSKYNTLGDKFDVEAELARISKTATERSDTNTFLSLFKTRFYLQNLIRTLTLTTLENTHAHTVYVDLLTQLKDWIDESPDSRFVDIVIFNYDNLVEKAMDNVYSVDWRLKNEDNQLTAYYSGKNLRIYKPHGSINWGREILKGDNQYSYSNNNEAFREFDQLELTHSFQNIDPNIFLHGASRNFVPAIAVPFKEKAGFDECPQEMQMKMLEAVNNADKMITLGWKGADKNFTNLLTTNTKINEVYIVSPHASTNLDSIFSEEILKPIESTFGYFVSETPALEGILKGFDNK